jgi:hypothetical protein
LRYGDLRYLSIHSRWYDGTTRLALEPFGLLWKYSIEPPRTREQDALHLFTTERVFDAFGQGEIQALGLDHDVVVESMVEKVPALLR